jgi:hypothetical protein
MTDPEVITIFFHIFSASFVIAFVIVVFQIVFNNNNS